MNNDDIDKILDEEIEKAHQKKDDSVLEMWKYGEFLNKIANRILNEIELKNQLYKDRKGKSFFSPSEKPGSKTYSAEAVYDGLENIFERLSIDDETAHFIFDQIESHLRFKDARRIERNEPEENKRHLFDHEHRAINYFVKKIEKQLAELSYSEQIKTVNQMFLQIPENEGYKIAALRYIQDRVTGFIAIEVEDKEQSNINSVTEGEKFVAGSVTDRNKENVHLALDFLLSNSGIIGGTQKAKNELMSFLSGYTDNSHNKLTYRKWAKEDKKGRLNFIQKLFQSAGCVKVAKQISEEIKNLPGE